MSKFNTIVLLAALIVMVIISVIGYRDVSNDLGAQNRWNKLLWHENDSLRTVIDTLTNPAHVRVVRDTTIISTLRKATTDQKKNPEKTICALKIRSMPHVRISVRYDPNGVFTLFGMTNSEGQYMFSVPPGHYSIFVTSQEYPQAIFPFVKLFVDDDRFVDIFPQVLGDTTNTTSGSKPQ